MPLLLGVTDIIVAGDSVSQVPDGHAELTVDKTGILCDMRQRGAGGVEGAHMKEWESGQERAGKSSVGWAVEGLHRSASVLQMNRLTTWYLAPGS